jgi:hypothetical protein
MFLLFIITTFVLLFFHKKITNSTDNKLEEFLKSTQDEVDNVNADSDEKMDANKNIKEDLLKIENNKFENFFMMLDDTVYNGNEKKF